MEQNNQSLVEQYNKEYSDVVLPVTVFIGIETVIGFFGNLIVLYVFIFRYHVCNFKYFVLCLAFVDLTSTLTAMPGEMLTLIRWFTFPNNALCKIKSYFNIYSFSCETYCLLIIAIDRYRKVCVPFGWQIKPRMAYLLCLLINVVAAIIALPVTILWGERQIQRVYKETNITLILCEKDQQFADTKHPLQYVIPLLVMYAICFTIMFVLYIFVARTLRQGVIFAENETSPPPAPSMHKHTSEDLSSSTDSGLKSDTTETFSETSFSSVTENSNKAQQGRRRSSSAEFVTNLNKDQPSKSNVTERLEGIRYCTPKREGNGNTVLSETNKQNETSQYKDDVSEEEHTTNETSECKDDVAEEEHTSNDGDEHSTTTVKGLWKGMISREDRKQNKTDRLQKKTHIVKRTRKLEKRLKKITLIMLILTTIFIVTAVVYRTMMSFVADGDVLDHISNTNRAVYFFFMRLYFINHVINPIVYYVLDLKFRKVINNWKKIICCRTKALHEQTGNKITGD